MTRTIESSITELQELKNKTTEISDFLKGKEFSPSEYKKEYDSIEIKLNTIRSKVNEIVIFFNEQRDKGDVSIQQANGIQALLSSFKELKTSFDGLITPTNFDKKLDELKPIELGNLSTRSTFSDISLNPEELSKLKPEKLLAKTSDGIEYYQITYDGQTTILRYNPNSSGGEIALYANVNINGLNKNEIKRLIINAERQGFRDVEMDGTWNLATVGLAATAGGIVGGKLGLGFGTAFVPGLGTAVGGVVGGVVGGSGGAIIAGISTAWDEDYTSEDYKNDFGGELEKLKVTRSNYKT